MESRPVPLETIALFKGMTSQQLQDIAASLRLKRLRAGANLLTADTPGDALYVILSGTVKVCLDGAEGDEVIVAMLGAGELVGELSVLDSNRRSANVVVQEDTVVVWMERSAFDRLLQDAPVVARNLLPILSRRIRLSTEQILALCALDVYGKVARQLLVFACQYGEPNDQGVTIPMRLTQTDVAGLVGASRERVNRAFVSLRQRRLIAVDSRHRITVRSMERLAAVVESR